MSGRTQASQSFPPSAAKDLTAPRRGIERLIDSILPFVLPAGLGLDPGTSPGRESPPSIKRAESDQVGILTDEKGPSIPIDIHVSASRRLAGHSFPEEAIDQIEAIIARKDETRSTADHLPGDAIQTIIDVIHEVLHLPGLPSRLRRKCLRALCRICGRRALLPRSLQIPICYNRLELPCARGGYADVWMGNHRGQKVAVKVLRVYLTSDLDRTRRRFCKEVMRWKALNHPNVLSLLGVTMDKDRFVMVSEWMTNGNINQFIKAHGDANRIQLLKDVARGLMYIHDQAMVHGDLKGANILIDQNCRACLADFGFLGTITDPTNPTTSSSHMMGGTTRWMSPELIAPEKSDPKDSRPTKQSDCYALGMVIYEVLSCQAPFASFSQYTVMRKVVDGERPERPEGVEGAWFTDDLWQTLNQCWDARPESRPSSAVVLECLERVSGDPPEDSGADGDDQSLTRGSFRKFSRFDPRYLVAILRRIMC